MADRVSGAAPCRLALGILALALLPPAVAHDVTGRVLDEAGRPIAGARVARGSDLRGREDVPETTTDADGRFVMAGVPAGPMVLTVQAPGHAPDLKSIIAAAGMAPVEFRLGPGLTIRGRIIDFHNKPIAGAPIAAVLWRGHHSLRWSTRTDAEGRFRWDEAPADGVMIDVGQFGLGGMRLCEAMPGAPEWTMSMPRPLHVRGRVTDAETGRPIRPFTLVPGDTPKDTRQIWWRYFEAKEISGLSYDVLLETGRPLRILRVEAVGYLPGLSRPLKDDEEDVVVHFALRRGAGVGGIARLPGGPPLAGAEVMLATPERWTSLTNGHPQPWDPDQWVVRTRTDGRFQLPPREPPYTIVVLHDRGYAERVVTSRPAAPLDLTIRPWGRVEGALRIGRRTGVGVPLSLERRARPDPDRRLYWRGSTTSDVRGRYAFERVVPGAVQISRLVPSGGTSTEGGSPSVVIDVAAGQTVRIDLGGTGRPIVGKVVLPAGIPGGRPRTFRFGDLSRRPGAGQGGPGAGPRPSEAYIFAVDRDGSFRIEDVEAGTYEIRIDADDRPPGDRPIPGQESEVVASARRTVVVPPMPGGRSDEPLDLGAIPATIPK